MMTFVGAAIASARSSTGVGLSMRLGFSHRSVETTALLANAGRAAALRRSFRASKARRYQTTSSGSGEPAKGQDASSGLSKGLDIPTSANSTSAAAQSATAAAATTVARRGIASRFLGRFPVIKYTLLCGGSIVFGLSAFILLVLAYDFTTYREAHVDKVPTAPLALKPNPGGPKNLPIIESYVDDWQDEETKELSTKERLVIVGGGWGAVAVLQHLDPKKYNVTLISPTNFFLFTPLLPSATVGTVEPRSLVEPLRRIIARLHGHYIEGKAVDVVFPSGSGDGRNLLEVQVIDGHDEGLTGREGEEASVKNAKSVYVPYDKLIVACGSVSNTHGVPGLENCFQLKTIKDARAIRSHVLDNLEMAALPTTSQEERDRLLSFVVCGGGPTGVETAAELYDMVNEDVIKHYPKLLRASTHVHVIQSREHILNTYSERISEYAERKFSRDGVDLITNARVKKVEADKVIYTVKQEGTDEVKEVTLPSGFTLWSTGIAMNPFTKRLTQLLPNQFHLKALQVDSHLRVRGAPESTMYAVGDASAIDTRLIDHLYEWVDKHDTDHDGSLTYDEFVGVVKDIGRRFPLASRHFEKMDKKFKEYDTDNDGKLGLNELASMFMDTTSHLTTLPATAQVASQQGKYLAGKLNHLAKIRDSKAAVAAIDEPKKGDHEDANCSPFHYRDLGSLAYIGNAAAFDIPFLPEKVGQFAGGLFAMYAWRSFYISEQASSRTRLLLLIDYMKRGVYGRDISRL